MTQTNTQDPCGDYKFLVESASQAIGVAQDGVFKYTNKKASEISGYSAEELKNKPFTEIIHPEDRQKVGEYYARRMKGENVPEFYDFKFVKKSGEEIWAEIHTTLISWNGESASLVFMSDVSDRKRIEEELRQSEARLSAIFKVSPVSISLTRLSDGKIIEANEASASIFGYKREELLGHTTLELRIWANQSDRDKFTDEVKRGAAKDKENLFRRKNGDIFFGLMSAEAVQVGDENFVLTTILDIDERKKNEQRMKDQYEQMEKQDKFMIDRENKMIELKKEVDYLLKELNRPIKYGNV